MILSFEWSLNAFPQTLLICISWNTFKFSSYLIFQKEQVHSQLNREGGKSYIKWGRWRSIFQLLKIPATYFLLGVRGFRKSDNWKNIFFFPVKSCGNIQQEFFFFLFFWARHAACRILVPPPGFEPAPPAVEAQSPNHWTVRQVPIARIVGLPWWHSGWESACQCRGHRFEPWSRKIPHATEQLSPCATTTEPVP